MHHHHRRHGLPEGDSPIIEAQADYLLAVKENQGRLYDDVRDLFEGAEEYDFEGVPYDFARTLNKGHGRLETRQCWVITDPDCLDYLQNRQQCQPQRRG